MLIKWHKHQQYEDQLNTASATQRAVGYLRVSTPGQAGEQHSSLETQESRFKEYCQRQGLLPDPQFVDVVSGRRDDRKEYRRMVEYALTGAAEVIVVQFPGPLRPEPQRVTATLLGATGRGCIGSRH